MRKKFSVYFIILAITLFMSTMLLSFKTNAFADEVQPLTITSREAILLDADSKTVIFKQNEKEKRPIASMCKIMTLLLCFEEIDAGRLSFDEEIVVSKNASSMGGSQVFLEENCAYKVGELIKSIVVGSANDACVAMAERISGSERNFVDLMNAKASQIKMYNTVFTNCTGLPKAGQYSTAEDVSLMFLELINHKSYFDYSNIWLSKIEHKDGRYTEISNTNKLIRYYEGCDSGKTGYTSEAGHCLTASAKRNGMRLISVIIDAPNSKIRFKETSDLFNFGFDNYTNKLLVTSDQPLQEKICVENGKKEQVEIVASSSLYLFCQRNQTVPVEIVLNAPKKVKAPINKGDILGKIEIYSNGKLINYTDILALEDVQMKEYGDKVNDIIKDWAL